MPERIFPMSEINQSDGLVRGPDGVLYRVSADGCDPVDESRAEQPMNGTAGVRRAVEDSSAYATARSFVEPGDHVAARSFVEPGDQVTNRAG
jgi:hypothetical protein